MKRPASTAANHAKKLRQGAGTTTPVQRETARKVKEAPSRYASPPCYLAEFFDADFAGRTTK